MPTLYQTLDKQYLSSQLRKRERDAHKGDFGHVLVIGGDYGMGGAVRLCAEGALRVGAGLVSVATHPAHVALIFSARPEIMCHSVQSVIDLTPLLQKATVIVIGPGLGKSDWSKTLLAATLVMQKPLIVDADALNLLSEQPEKIVKNNRWILTPHSGEAARLLHNTSETVQSDRLNAAKKIVAVYGGVTVLKGAGTLIAADHEIPAMCPFGNAGMATAGMGDVLSGVIAGLVAQKLPLVSAAKTGVLMHALAGDEAARVGGERGLVAMDLMDWLHKLANA